MTEHLVNLLLGVWTLLQGMVGRTAECLLEQDLRALQLGQLGGDAFEPQLGGGPQAAPSPPASITAISFRDSPACCPSRMKASRRSAAVS